MMSNFLHWCVMIVVVEFWLYAETSKQRDNNLFDFYQKDTDSISSFGLRYTKWVIFLHKTIDFIKHLTSQCFCKKKIHSNRLQYATKNSDDCVYFDVRQCNVNLIMAKNTSHAKLESLSMHVKNAPLYCNCFGIDTNWSITFNLHLKILVC